MRPKNAREKASTWHRSCDALYSDNAPVPGRAAALRARHDQSRHRPAPGVNAVIMSILDLIKATITCGAFAYLIYSIPEFGQVVLIGFLSLLWLCYARKTIASLRRR